MPDQKAVVKLYEMSANEEMRMMAEAREKAIRDEYSAMVYAKTTGKAEGESRGLGRNRFRNA